MRNICYVVMVFVVCLNLHSQQEEEPWRLGVFGHFNLNVHRSDFFQVGDIPNCCSNFQKGDGTGFTFGALYEKPIFESALLAIRLSYMDLGGVLFKEDTTTVIVDGNAQPGAFEHTMEGKFGNLGLDVMLSYSPYKSFYVTAGFRGGFNISSKFYQIEKLSKPVGRGTFVDENGEDTHSRTRNEFSGDMPDAKSFIGFLVMGVSYELPMNKERTLHLVPEIFYHHSFNEYVNKTDWVVYSIGGGFALKYDIMPPPEKEQIFKQEQKIDTIRIISEAVVSGTIRQGIPTVSSALNETETQIITTEILTRTDTLLVPKKYKLEADIAAYGVDKDGNEIANPKFVVEEFVSNRMDPLLNYIFFDENSSALPPKYETLSAQEAEKFDPDSLFGSSTMEIYYNVLNIIGSRLKKFPDASVTLTGCNAGYGDENNDLELSASRAGNIKNYLTGVWKINPDRIAVKSRNLPEKASTPANDPDKSQENRRVELSSDDQRILAPVFIKNVHYVANPGTVRFKLTSEAEAGAESWEARAYQKKNMSSEIFQSKNSGDPPGAVDWHLEKDQNLIPKYNEPLFYNLTVTDKKGQKYFTKDKSLPVEILTINEKRTQQIDDYEIEKFSLILFDFDSDNISGGNKKIVDLIKERVKPESTVEIKGYTDRTGNDDYNLKLSASRANSARKAIGINKAHAEGIGEKELLYNNDLPEGRFYCRTVEITVKTKVK